jgi:RNA polymerase sigma-70 factor (ECF subfamily)
MGTGRPSGWALNDATLVRWVREHGSGIRGYVAALVRDRSLAEDMVQEVFLRAWKQRESYVEQGSEKGYLFRIADRLVIDHRRAKSADSLPEAFEIIDHSVSAPLDELISRESAERLREGMGRLSEAQRRVLLLRYFGQLKFEEIAPMIGCPLATALSHARRGLEQLRAFFAASPSGSREGEL